MSAYLTCLEHLSDGRLPAIIPVTRNGQHSVFAVAADLQNARLTKRAAFSPDLASRLAAAFIVIHEARETAREYGYDVN